MKKSLKHRAKLRVKSLGYLLDFYLTSILDNLKGLPVVEVIPIPAHDLSISFLVRNKTAKHEHLKNWKIYKLTMPSLMTVTNYYNPKFNSVFRYLKMNLARQYEGQVRLKLVNDKNLVKEALQEAIKSDEEYTARKQRRTNGTI